MLSGNIKFKPDKEEPIRVKVYRSTVKDGQYSLICNEFFDDFKTHGNNGLMLMQKKTIKDILLKKEHQQRNPNRPYENSIAELDETLKTLEEAAKKRSSQNKEKSSHDSSIFMNFKIADCGALECGSNNVFYKIKLCSESGLALMESTPIQVSLTASNQSCGSWSSSNQNVIPEKTTEASTEKHGSILAGNNNNLTDISALNMVDTKEKIDEAATETLLKSINRCYCNASSPVSQPGIPKSKIQLFTHVGFNPGGEKPVRVKIYRSESREGKYSLICNKVLKDFQNPEINLKTGGKAKATRKIDYNESGESIGFEISDTVAADIPNDKVFYKMKLCSVDGLLLVESGPIQACSSWNYNRKDQLNNSVPDAIEVKPVFNGGRAFEAKGDIKLKSLKIDGRKVCIQTDGISTYTARINGIETKLSKQNVQLNYPGTPVAELEFTYDGNVHTLCTKLPPVPTGLRARTLDDGSVKLTWDPLVDRIDRKQFVTLPDIKLLRQNKVINICDISQTEFIDKQTEPGKVYTYSLLLNDAKIKVQAWTKEKDLAETAIFLQEVANPYPEISKATAYIYPGKPSARPVRISYWEPALYYERTGSPGMRVFSAALRKLGQNAEIELLDRTSRSNIIEEKVLTMSYEKSIMIKTLPADFTVLIKDYSRQQGNGVELWLIQNKTFDYISNAWMPVYFEYNDFLVWRIGSISEDDLKISEKTEELGDKLVAAINRRLFFKSAVAAKDASVPKKFVFNPLESVRQKTMVVENKAIGESIMIGLSDQMTDCNIMTRDNWKAIFTEQNLMREQGEKMDSDISGTVLISGRIWLENNQKQYLFSLTDIKTGICVGILQCSGTIEAVTTQLATACKKIKLAAPSNSTLTEQQKYEITHENLSMHNFFLTRFGSGENYFRKKEDSLSKQKEMNRPEFAEKQWQLGNMDNAVKILEEMWKNDKSAWEQLKKYHCEMGNYTRAMQIVETIIQQNNSNILLTEYSRLRTLAARNAAPENSYITKTEDQINAENFNDYMLKEPIRATEWNPGGECRTIFKLEVADGLKSEDWTKLPAVQKHSRRIKIHEDKGRNSTWRAEYLWESVPLISNDETMAKSRTAKLLGSLDMNTSEDTFSMIRTYFAIEKNPNVKLAPVFKRSQSGGGRYSDEKRNKAEDECNSGRKFMEIQLSLIMMIRESEDHRVKIGLDDMICIDILAQSGNSTAQKLLNEINAIKFPSSFEDFDKSRTGNYSLRSLLAFRVYRGDPNAINLALNYLRNNKYCFDFRDNLKDIYYLMAKSERKDIITAMLSIHNCKSKDAISNIRWGNQEMLRTMLFEHPELFEQDLYFYLIDGFNDPDSRHGLFYRQGVLYNGSEYWKKYVLWLGKPLSEFYREQTLNYKVGE